MTGPGASLRISVTRSRGRAVLRLDGELDCATAPDVEAALEALLADPEPPTLVVVDAARLRFADVAGLRPLVEARHRLPRGSTLQLRNATHTLVRVIRLLDLADEFGLDR